MRNNCVLSRLSGLDSVLGRYRDRYRDRLIGTLRRYYVLYCVMQLSMHGN